MALKIGEPRNIKMQVITYKRPDKSRNQTSQLELSEVPDFLIRCANKGWVVESVSAPFDSQCMDVSF